MYSARRMSLLMLLAIVASVFAYVPTGNAVAVPSHDTVPIDLEVPPQVHTNADEVTQQNVVLDQVASGDMVTPTMALTMTRLSGFDYADGNIESAVEIVAYDPISQQVFSTSAVSGTVEILDISDPNNPQPAGRIDVSTLAPPYDGGSPNSVAVKDGIVAVAVENDPKTDQGAVAFYTTNGTPLAVVGVGALPDMVTFTPNGEHVVVANEGEPNDDYTIDPEGSVSIIDLPPDFLASPTLTTTRTVRFNEFNAGGPRAGELPADVRIFGPNASVAQDLEPEYITVSPDSTTAYVTLQENNAVAVIDLMMGRVTAIVALGYKDHSFSGMQLFPFTDLPDLGTVQGTGQVIKLGGFSGLHYRGTQNGEISFVTHPDRGPVADATDIDTDGQPERLFALPDYNAQIVPFTLNPQSGALTLSSTILLKRSDDITPITGLPNLAPDPLGTPPRPLGTAYVDEEPRTVLGTIPTSPNSNGYDLLGADMEGIYEAGNGNFWMVDEYRPSIYVFDSDGTLQNRYVPNGSNLRGTVSFPATGADTLPEIYAQRWANRGFEAIAVNSDNGLVYAFIQSPIDNPDVADNANARNSRIIRILAIDATNGLVQDEYVYVLEPEAASDKIGDAVYIGNDEFYVIERDSSTGSTSSKKVFKVSLAGATDISGLPVAGTGGNLESLVTEDDPTNLSALTAAGVTPVQKELVVDLAEIGYYFSDKPEGLAILPDNQIAILNDNDFQLGGGISAGLIDTQPISTVLALIDLNEQPTNTNRLDASDRDNGINIQNWPVLGMYQPDAIASFQVGGQTYLVTANEGDSRDYDGFSEEERVRDLTLEGTVFPNAAVLQEDANLGRLKITTTQGDTDSDGDFDQLYSYGARSFSVWNSNGQLVWDSGDQFARITAEQGLPFFNVDDSRSDDKGAEPEAITTGEIAGRTYAFIGLERVGGVMIYDVTNPQQPAFVEYVPSMAGDISPEGLAFVPACDSPNGNALLIIGHEISNTVAIYEITSDMVETGCSTTLTLLHNNDGESGLLPTTNTVGDQQVPVGGIAAFKTVADREIAAATQAGNASLMVYAGDAFLASATIQCSFPIDSNNPLYDAIGQSQVPYDAHILGNHEFDYTPAFLKRFIDGFNGQQPFLSANLDFSGEPDFASLIDADGLIDGLRQDGRVIGRSLIVRDETTGQRFGIVGATTTNLASVSSPRNVTVLDLDATVIAVQGEIDRLQQQGVNKIILVSHLQDVQNDRDLIQRLSGVDLAVAGGGDDFLVNSSVDQNLQLLPGQSADEIEGEYPLTVTDATSRTVYLVTSVDRYRFLGRLDVRFDANGEVTEVIRANSYPRRVVEAGAAATNLGITDAVTPDPNIVTSVNTPVQACLNDLATPIARTEILFNVSRDGVRGGENNMGNLVADSFIDSYNRYASDSNLPPFSQTNPVVAIQNGGGIRQNAGDVLPRSGMVPGDITNLDTIDVLPFNNFITVIQEISPTLLLEVLSGIGTSGIYHVSNLRLDYTSATVNDETVYNINNITLVNFDGSTQLLVENGQPVPGAPNVTIVTNSFVAGREFAATEQNQTNLRDSNGSEILYEQPLREYLQNTDVFPVENGLPTIQSTDTRYQSGGEGRIIIDGLPPASTEQIFLPVVRR